MRLRILLPATVLLDKSVTKVVAEGADGEFCLLPGHRDFVASLVPGILRFVEEDGTESFVAVGEGILTKSGPEVRVAVRRASRHGQLGELERVVREEFQQLDERERVAHMVIARLESEFMRRFLKLEEKPLV
jgi:F-type H+-transporting ATPase subunit epsilon